MTAVRGSNTRGADGSVNPNAPSSALSPSAASTPTPSPITDAPTPTSAASLRTERKSCRRLAPTTRSNASSLVRCPTVIENVLKMVNAPTNSEINANTSSAVRKDDSSSFTALDRSLATV